MVTAQLSLALAPHDYRWQVQCTSSAVDRRTGEPFRWVLGCWSEASAHATAERVRREQPGVVAEAVRR